MSFPLAGNERTKTAVFNMLSSGKIPHAVLIVGGSGCGKKTLARFIAKAVLCEGENRPCGVCDGCRLFEGNNHPDMSVVAAESGKASISVNAVREIISQASIIPQRSNRKVFLIEDADTLTVNGQNALLKVLEEPPKSVVFILTAVSRFAVLETVASRCSVLTLSPVDEKTAADYIVSNINCDRQTALEAIREAHGSIGDALRIISGGSSDKSYDTAKKFVDILQNGSQYDMLKLLLPLEKNRKETLNFYNSLETVIAGVIKDCASKTLVRRYERLYGLVVSHKKLLKTNPNLSLLLTALSAEAMTER